jgi:hypothetical protein
MIHIHSRGYKDDTHTEQRIHRGYTYSAEYIYTEDIQRIHIQSREQKYRGYIVHLQSRGHKYIAEDTQYIYRAEDTNTLQRTCIQSRGHKYIAEDTH